MGKSETNFEKAAAQAGTVEAGLRWYVVRTHAGRERIARDQLVRQGYGDGAAGREVYLPLALTLDRRGELVARPFFPGFLFVRLDILTAAWRPILSTIGVRSMLMSGEQPMWLGAEMVERVRAQEEGGFIKLADRPAPAPCTFQAGQKVQVRVGGTLQALEATFCEPVDARRVAILLSLLGRDSRVVVRLDQLTDR